MLSNHDDQLTIREYLLGQLNEDSCHEFEQRLLTDDGLFEELLVGEDELIDQYLSGELSENEIEMFEKTFLVTSARQQKLRFAKLFKKYARVHASEDLQQDTGPARAKPSSAATRSWRQFFSASPWAVAAFAALVIFAALGIWRIYFYESDVDKGLVALNAAYHEQRPIEARITQLNYAPYATTRGNEPARVNIRELDRAERILRDAVRDQPGAASYHALGRFYLARKNFDKAIAQFEEALKADTNNAQIYADLGAALLERGKLEEERNATDKLTSEPGANSKSGRGLEDFARSLEELNKALELDANLLEAMFNRALCYQYMMLPRQAAEQWREYLKKDSTSEWADEARANLKVQEQQLNQKAKSKEDLLKQFLAAQSSQNDDEAWRLAGISRDDLAGANISQQLLTNYIQLKTGGSFEDAARSLQSLSYLGKLENQRAREHYSQDIANNFSTLNAAQEVIYSRALGSMNSGYALYGKSQLPEAIAAFGNAMQTFAEVGAYAERSLAEYWIAYCHSESLDLFYCRTSLPILIEFCREHDYRWLLMRSLYLMSSVEFGVNEPSKAIDLCKRALQMGTQIGDSIGVFNALDSLTEIYRSLNNYSSSISAISQSQPMIDCCTLNPIKIWRHHAIVASAFNSAGYPAAAVAFQREATRQAVDFGELTMICLSYAHLGLMLGQQGDCASGLDNAWLAYNTAAGRANEPQSNVMMAYAALQIASLYSQQGENNRAAENYKRSIDLYRNLDFSGEAYHAHKGLFRSYVALGDDQLAAQELNTTLGLLEQYRTRIVENDNRNKFFDSEQSVFDLAIDFAYKKLKNKEQAFDYSEDSRARSLFDLLKSSPKIPAGNAPKSVPSLSWAEIKSQMPAETQLIQYAVLENKLLIWVVSKHDFTLTEKDITQKELNDKIQEYTEALAQQADGGETTELGKQLFADLILPVQPVLDPNKQLCIIPDKALNSLPFAALVSTAGKYLIEDYCITYAPSASVFIQASSHALALQGGNAEKLLSVGNPNFDHESFPTLSELPDAAREARSIGSYYSAPAVYVGSAARKDVVVGAMAGAQVVHLALHAIDTPGDELHSHLLLAKDANNIGALDAYELYRMKLPRTRLLVLSACRSGTGDYYRGEGMLSLARPFLVAGVPLVIASLWPVDSKATADLMINFHALRKPQRVTTAEALRKAQIAVLTGQDQRLRNPYFWAGFFVLGGYASF
jgi:CHAT domain-containing protein